MAVDAAEWLTLTEAAAECRLSVPVFIKHMQDGSLPYEGYKLGSGRAAQWRIRRMAAGEAIPQRSTA